MDVPSTSTKGLEFHPNQPTMHGVREDVENFIEKTVELFDESATLRISHFTKVWQSTKFGLVMDFL